MSAIPELYKLWLFIRRGLSLGGQNSLLSNQRCRTVQSRGRVRPSSLALRNIVC
jgi:hypothetical protein